MKPINPKDFEPTWNNVLIRVVEDKPKSDIVIPDEVKEVNKDKYYQFFVEKVGPGIGKVEESNNVIKPGQEVWLKANAYLTRYKDNKEYFVCSEHDILAVK